MEQSKRRRKSERSASLLGLAVLSQLMARPMHPYELSTTLRDHGMARSVRFTHGSLYTVIGQLQRAGFIGEVETSRQGARPERTVYAITDEGRKELQDWLSKIVEEPAFEYPTFVTGLALLVALHPSEAVDLLRRRVDRLKQERLATQRGIDMGLNSGIQEIFLIEEDYRVAIIDAEIEFVRTLIGRITNKKTGWEPQWAAEHKRMQRLQPWLPKKKKRTS